MDAVMSEAAMSEAAWRARAEKAIGGSLDTLTATSMDGVPIAPLYAGRSADGPRPWRQSGPWSVVQRLDHPDVERANRLALLDLEGGADALALVFAASPFARGFGLAADADLDSALENVELDFISLRLDAGAETIQAAAAIAALVERRRLTSAALAVDLGFDPIGLEARTGAAPTKDDLTSILSLAEGAGLAGRPLLSDGRAYHEAGAGEAQELAAVLATGVAYLRRLGKYGLSLDAARGTLAFLLAADADILLGLTKFRAMRRLWARVEVACGLDPKPIRLHAETAWRMMTRRDPWVNVMRATAATFAAGLGGADTVAVLPFTLPLGLPDEPGRRLARNVQRVLIDEANLAKVDDAAAGSRAFEALSDDLCEKAWSLFQAIEAEGGIEASLRAGALQARIAETARARAAVVATLTLGIVGTSRFVSLDAPNAGVLDDVPRPTADSGPNALPSRREAEPFEALRDRADAIAADHGRPVVFLATLETPASFGVRATYAANFFAAAGIEASATSGAQDVPALAERFRTSGTGVACLCGSDAVYAEQAVAAAEALRAAGARRILLAGKPGEYESAWRKVGIDAFIHDGCNAPQVLSETLEFASNSQGATGSRA